MIRRQPRSTPFPCTTLFRAWMCRGHGELDAADGGADQGADLQQLEADAAAGGLGELGVGEADAARRAEDRKSTRLNSSHANISYAVFCLKKKKKRRAVRLLD